MTHIFKMLLGMACYYAIMLFPLTTNSVHKWALVWAGYYAHADSWKPPAKIEFTETKEIPF